jgi:hypothetical protein
VPEAVCRAARRERSRCCCEVLLLPSANAAGCCCTHQPEPLGKGRRTHSQARTIMTAKTAAAADAAGICPGRLKLLSKHCTISKG